MLNKLITMNEKINIAEILKDKFKGVKLYSPALGALTLSSICMDAEYPIGVLDKDGDPWEFDEYGRVSEHGECMLFPSMYDRDWSKYKTKETEYEFKAFQQVLVRCSEDGKWTADIFSHKEDSRYPYRCVGNFYKQCIPYEGNEELLGTTDKPKENK